MRYFLAYILLIPCFLFSQKQKKELFAKRINSNVIIDGKLNEFFWSDIPFARNFQMIEPINGKLERSTQKTEVKFAYDDYAIYIGAELHDKNAGYDDPNITGIMQELGPRDQEGKSTDVFGLFINPFNDGINEFAFLVTAAGVQIDKRIILTTNGYIEDKNWDAVWESAVSIHKDGWRVEIKIPYSAIRFPNIDKQVWGLNIYRELRRLREEYSWNFIDTRQGKIGNQNGLLKGIEYIKPPIRLSFNPYVSSVLVQEPITSLNKNYQYNFNYSGGVDLKYGFSIPTFSRKNINLTLDMILLPEFQQVEFDPLVLNISPYEIRYDEKRNFFTEGIDLFQKGNLFYSRRIGGTPITNPILGDNEIISRLPENTRLFNGTKISGRSEDGWGIGLFNAITRNTYAQIQDTLLNIEKEQLIEPITNYNMLVLDKSFNQSSFISFINTNVSRKIPFRNANVSALVGSITNKKQTHTYDASIKGSIVGQADEKNTGFSTLLNIQKINGKIKYNIRNYIESDEYDINDMGFLYQNNEINNEANISYNIFSQDEKIAKKLNIKKGNVAFGVEHKTLYRPYLYNSFIIKASSFVLNNNHFFMSLKSRFFLEEHDYFESRIINQVFIKPPAIKTSFSTSSNFNKPISLNNNFSFKWRFNNNYNIWKDYKNALFYYRINPRFRISNHIFLEYILAIEIEQNQIGWIEEEDSNPIFSRRNQNTYTNKLVLNYTLNPQTYIKLIARHYWSTIENFSFYSINESGLLYHNDYNKNEDINFNTWNLDLNFSWQYKPGSLLSIVWQNQLTSITDQKNSIFTQNINDFFKTPTTNIVSFKLTYYIDYIELIKPRNDKN